MQDKNEPIMSAVKIAGVMRACAFSPNSIGKDIAIFNAVAEGLRGSGAEVNVYSEEEFRCSEITEEVVLNMCREQESISKLRRLEQEGRLVINSGCGIANCTREQMTHLLMRHGIAHPESIVVNTDEDAIPAIEAAAFDRCWIKRGDSHATHKEDVCYCKALEDMGRVMKEFSRRGIKRAVINRHLEGDLVKFYGVSGEPFFHWFYPLDRGHSKYGHEAVNGKPRRLESDTEALKKLCCEAADVLDVKIYGGDCLVGADGTVRIIDFNDWPSFSPCRGEGAEAITECVRKLVNRRFHKNL